MKVRIRCPRDFFAGVIFLSFGLCALLVGHDFPMGSALRMGAGYFPVARFLLFLVGLALFFGPLGNLFVKLDCEPSSLLLGFVLGPMIEDNRRRAMLLSRGNPAVVFPAH